MREKILNIPEIDELISKKYIEQNMKLHISKRGFGGSGHRWAEIVLSLLKEFKIGDMLDYGCGQSTLHAEMRNNSKNIFSKVQYKEYDPCVIGKNICPSMADLVTCTDVLEHVEPELLDNVLQHLFSLTKKVLFLNINIEPANKVLPDGRNAHLIVEDKEWWLNKLKSIFIDWGVRVIPAKADRNFNLILMNPATIKLNEKGERDISKITLVYSYYDNPEMFIHQQRVWGTYSKQAKNDVEIIVTDDCSSNYPAKNHILENTKKLKFRLFTIDEKVKWNWLECRNIGAKYANSMWVLMTDMDHVVSRKVIDSLLFRVDKLHHSFIYQFGRVKAPDMSAYKHHNDTFFLRKKLFWRCGGYDEDYAGLYGTSGRFRRRLYSVARGNQQFSDLKLILYGREVIPDASTTEFARKEGRKSNELEVVRRWKEKNGRGIKTFLRPFHEEKI